MEKILFVMFMIFVSAGAFAQETIVSFSGRLNGSEYCQLDSIVVTNLDNHWSETVVYPDSVIVFSARMGSDVMIAESQGLLQNVPNPFESKTRVDLIVSSSENVSMLLLDISGKVYAQYDGRFNEGTHSFVVTAANPQTYILNAVVGEKSYSIKMVNVGDGGSCGIEYAGLSGNVISKLTSSNEFNVGDNMRYVGYATIGGIAVPSIIVVQRQQENEDLVLNFYYPGQGTLNGHEWVDLGLPSGTRWATCNVGASSPEGYGTYFAWGETFNKAMYDWDTYIYYNGSSFTKYNDSDNLVVIQPSDDAATIIWGDGWRIPTMEELQELFEYCNHNWIVNGMLLTGSNGNTIFLPASGDRFISNVYNVGIEGYYWLNSLDPESPYYAYYLFFSSNRLYLSSLYRLYGLSIRPVCSPRN